MTNERTNEVIVHDDKASKIWTFHLVSGLVQIFASSDEFRFQHTYGCLSTRIHTIRTCAGQIKLMPIDDCEVVYILLFFSSLFFWFCVVLSVCFSLKQRKFDFQKFTHRLYIYRCVTAHRSNEDNANNSQKLPEKTNWRYYKLEYYTGSHSQLVVGIAQQPSFRKLNRY